MADAEGGEVGHRLGRGPEAVVRRQLPAVGGDELSHLGTARQEHDRAPFSGDGVAGLVRGLATRRRPSPGGGVDVDLPRLAPRAGGSVNGIGSWWPLSRSRKRSSTIRSPRRSVPTSSPLRKAPTQRACGSCHCSSVISVPSGSNQAMSGSAGPPPGTRIVRPWKNRRRRNVGCVAPERDERATVKVSRSSSSVRPVDPGDLVVLAVGVVVAAAACGRARRRAAASARPGSATAWPGSCAAAGPGSASTSGSSVGPSTPQFQLRLCVSPSSPPSPLASLCFSL